MLELLKERVLIANLELPEKGLVLYTWGNVSGIDREKELIVIKPSGIDYKELKRDDMVVVDFEGNVIEGSLNPSSDTATHIELYKAFQTIEGIVHTHSTWATIWAQAGRDIFPYGTTHADYFSQSIPCTRKMLQEEIEGFYEKETGKVIIETLQKRNLSAEDMMAILVHSHGPFTWGNSVEDAVYHAVVLEEIARLALNTELINHHVQPMQKKLLKKHFTRKHGVTAYYGQKK